MKLNLPNKLVILRFFMAFATIGLLMAEPNLSQWAFHNSWTNANVSYVNIIVLVLFVVASATDWLDGYLARKNNQITNFGKYFDPIADKLLVNTTLIMFAVMSRIPAWVVILFIIRDLIVEGVRMNASSQGKVIAASWWAKVKTFAQMIAIPILFILYPEAGVNGFDYTVWQSVFVAPLYVALVVSLGSGYIYIKEGLKDLFN